MEDRGEISVEVDEAKLEEARLQIEKEWKELGYPLEFTDNLREEEDYRHLVPMYMSEEEYLWHDRRGYFNNFICNLPYSETRAIIIKYGRQGTYDTPNRELESQPPRLEGVSQEEYNTYYRISDRYLNQSLRQFHETIAAAIRAEGIADEELKNLVEEGNDHVAKRGIHLYRRLFPTFVRLKAMGYSNHDLTG